MAVRAAVAPTSPFEPPTVRQQQRGGGPTAVMSSAWVDPADTTPGASKYARQVTGWRTYCPLRKMAAMKGTQVGMEHIFAADKLRAAADLATHGYSAERDGGWVDRAYGPRGGPSDGAIEQVYACLGFSRVMKLFTGDQQRMIVAVLLENRSVHAWCSVELAAHSRRLDPKMETGRLLGILDVLVAHYRTEIERDVRSGAVPA